MPRRFQFSLKTLLWLMLCVACFLAGEAGSRRRANSRRSWEKNFYHLRIKQEQDERKKVVAEQQRIIENLKRRLGEE